MNECRDNRAGFALMMVMVLVAVSTVLGLSYLAASSVKLAGIDNLASAARARYVAESGLQHALWVLRRDPGALAGSTSGPLGPYNVDETDDCYSFWAEPVAGEMNTYRVTASATASGLTRTVSMTAKFVSRYREKVFSYGPLYYWSLGDTSGSMARDLCGMNHGVYNNGVLLGRTGAIAHFASKCAEFDGYNDYVNLGNLDLFGSELTILAWLNSDDWGKADARVISKAVGTGDNDHYYMVSTVGTGGEIRLRFRLRTDGWTAKLEASTGACEAGKWVFAAAVYDGTKMQLYKDGVNVGEMPKSGELDTDPFVPAWIGSNPTTATSKPWDGTIDEVVIFSRALSASEIEALYQARLPDVYVLSWDE